MLNFAPFGENAKTIFEKQKLSAELYFSNLKHNRRSIATKTWRPSFVVNFAALHSKVFGFLRKKTDRKSCKLLVALRPPHSGSFVTTCIALQRSANGLVVF